MIQNLVKNPCPDNLRTRRSLGTIVRNRNEFCVYHFEEQSEVPTKSATFPKHDPK